MWWWWVERRREKMEMEGERIGIVLVRASELHSKIASCINNNNNNKDDDSSEDESLLLSISDAFISLDSHLSSLQALQQQQQYEREAVIRDIEHTRKMLLKKLSEYKGEHMDVIREAEAFASMKVDHDNELLLPYPTLAPDSLVLDNTLHSTFSNACKLPQNGHDSRDESNNSQNKNSSNKLLWGGFRFLVTSTAKTMLTLVGVISLLSLAGFEPKFKKKGSYFPTLTLFDSDQKRLGNGCPPGKMAVMENGEVHCIVKERVEVPFDSVAADPNVNYGCG